MASFHRPTKATHVINEKITIDTTDHEDHTFSGIVFPVKCKSILPVDKLIITTVSVRGDLGPLTVWVSKQPNEIFDDPTPPLPPPAANHGNNGPYALRNQRFDSNPPRTKIGRLILSPKYWTKVYDKTHCPSRRDFCELTLDTPIILRPGQCCGIYIHSSLPSDTAIVYDRKQKSKTYQDDFLAVYPGRAHVSTRVFGTNPIWGYGAAWRNNREFVGRLSYGVVYKLWNPNSHYDFGGAFQSLAIVLFACQRHWSSPFSALPDDCIFYILNMCRWDWVKDNFQSVRKAAKAKRDREELRLSATAEYNTITSATNDNVTTSDLSTARGPGEEEQAVMEGSCKGGCHGKSNHDDTVVLETQETNHVDDEEGMVVVINDDDYEEMSTSDRGDNDDDDDSEYDEDADEMSESDEDEGYTDHSSKRTFRFEDYDEYASNDEAQEQDRLLEEERRQLEQRRAQFWTHNHGRLMRLFMDQQQPLHPMHSQSDDDDDEDYDEDEHDE